MVTRASARDPAIEWLRVMAILVVVLVHAAQVFSPWQTWHVQNVERSSALGALTVSAWPWVMPLFMFLAGVAAWHSLARRTTVAFVEERIRRLLLPLILGALLVVPPQVYIERVNQGRFQGSFFDFYPHFFEGFYPRGNFEFAHLWFLAYLFTYALIFLPLFARIQSGSYNAFIARCEKILCASPTSFVVLPALPIALTQLAFRWVFPQTLQFYNDIALHAQLVLAYTYGYLLAGRPRLQEMVLCSGRHAVVLALVSVITMTALVWTAGGILPQAFTGTYLLTWVVFSFATWNGIVAGIAIARRYRSARSRWASYASRRVFVFYILHQTVIVFIAYVMVRADINIAAKYVLLVCSATVLTLILSELVERAVSLLTPFSERPSHARHLRSRAARKA